MIEIDGAFGSGGGQILRTACALSAVTRKPCHIFNIRRGRPRPGLATQHLLGIQSLAKLYNGRLEGDFLGSTEIRFWPGEIQAKDLHIKIETAGSVTLVLQTLILPCLFALDPIKITFNGGATDTFFSPTFDHFRYVFLQILEKLAENRSLSIKVNLIKRGYYPEGGAEVEVTISSLGKRKTFRPFNLTETGSLKRILVISGASEFLKSKKVAERQIAGVREVLGKLKLPIEEKVEYYRTRCPGSQICIIASFDNTVIGVDGLGKLGKRAEDVGKETALKLLTEQKTGACLDRYLADQILPYLALSRGKSSVTVSEITNHCKTNIWVIEKFFKGKFKLEGNLIEWNPS